MRWMNSPSHGARRRAPASEEFHAWVLSLPWVVERPHLSDHLGIRVFAIACEPLDIRQLWLVTGLVSRVAVVVPDSMAHSYEADGLGRPIAPMPADHTFFALHEVPAIDLERVVLEAYGVALAP